MALKERVSNTKLYAAINLLDTKGTFFPSVPNYGKIEKFKKALVWEKNTYKKHNLKLMVSC